jgi:hypothetical protein
VFSGRSPPPLALDQLVVAGSLLKGSESGGAGALGAGSLTDAHLPGGGHARERADEPTEQEGAKATAAVGVHACGMVPR